MCHLYKVMMRVLMSPLSDYQLVALDQKKLEKLRGTKESNPFNWRQNCSPLVWGDQVEPGKAPHSVFCKS